jgi:hypothetical protein
MPADSFIHCRVDPELKAAIRRLAENQQLTDSALIKQVLKDVARVSGALGLKIGDTAKRPRDARLYVRLHPHDRLLLREHAARRGMAPATYVAVLVRAHLNDLAPLPEQELQAVRGAVSQLSALGRILNQMARALNRGEPTSPPGRQEVVAMGQICLALHDRVKALLLANAKSWRKGHAETHVGGPRGTASKPHELRQERSGPP